MSREHEIAWQLEQKRKEELRKKRATEYSQKALKEFEEKYKAFIENEYDVYIPSEMEELNSSIENIKNTLQENPIEAQSLCYSIQYTFNNMDFIVQKAKNEFSKKDLERYNELQNWKAQQMKNEKSNLLKKNVNLSIAEIENEKFENSENKQKLLSELNELKENISSESDEKIVNEKISEIRKESENALISETARKELVKAIIQELRSQEFTVEKPKILGEGKDSYVLVKAKKPSGKQAQCKINLEGKLNYRFDNYEGMTCLKDIEKFNVDLQKIYSVNLSDERVIWENPDRLSRTQSVSSTENRRNK